MKKMFLFSALMMLMATSVFATGISGTIELKHCGDAYISFDSTQSSGAVLSRGGGIPSGCVMEFVHFQNPVTSCNCIAVVGAQNAPTCTATIQADGSSIDFKLPSTALGVQYQCQ